MPEHASFAEAVVAAVAALQAGEVVSYGEIAAQVGRPGAARAVGNLLASTPLPDLPWWRVVRADGTLATGKGSRQAALLRAEGVTVEQGRVVATRR